MTGRIGRFLRCGLGADFFLAAASVFGVRPAWPSRRPDGPATLRGGEGASCRPPHLLLYDASHRVSSVIRPVLYQWPDESVRRQSALSRGERRVTRKGRSASGGSAKRFDSTGAEEQPHSEKARVAPPVGWPRGFTSLRLSLGRTHERSHRLRSRVSCVVCPGWTCDTSSRALQHHSGNGRGGTSTTSIDGRLG